MDTVADRPVPEDPGPVHAVAPVPSKAVAMTGVGVATTGAVVAMTGAAGTTVVAGAPAAPSPW